MATEVKMPKLGLTMVEGRIVEWRKKEGDPVQKGEIIFIIETDKVSFEVEASISGVLVKIIAQVEDVKAVGEIVAYIAQPDGDISSLTVESGKETLGSSTEEPETDESEESVVRTSPGGDRIKISPIARKIAHQSESDISLIVGSGPRGRIVKKDVLSAIEKARSVEKEVVPTPAPQGTPVSERVTLVPLTGIRRTIAARMTQSFQTPHFWFEVQANATRFREYRKMMLPMIEAQTGQRLTYTDFITAAVARALEIFPIVNSRWTEKGIEMLEDIHVGIATNIDAGLIVPVVKNANRKSLAEITRTRSDITGRAKEGKLGIDEMTGSTITITNLGNQDVERGCPVINPPEAAIIGVGAMKDRAVVVDGSVVPLFTVNLILGIDHRVLDGFIGSEFLNKVKAFVEEPLLML